MIDFDKSEPAFPCEFDYLGSNRAAANGMSLRDYFAARAMQATVTGITSARSAVEEKHLDGLAKMAYLIADAMLAARAATQPKE